MFYYDTQLKSLCSYAIPGINYGICHFSEDGNRPAEGMNIYNHDKMTGSFFSAEKRFIEAGDNGNIHGSLKVFREEPTEDLLNDFRCIFSELKNGGFESRTRILLDFLGFRDSGIHINGDYLFIYDFFSSFRKFEIYLDGETGKVTEINTFDYDNSKEVKYPVNADGFISMFTEILEDLFRMDLSHDTVSSDALNISIAEVSAAWPFKVRDTSVSVPLPEDESGDVPARNDVSDNITDDQVPKQDSDEPVSAVQPDGKTAGDGSGVSHGDADFSDSEMSENQVGEGTSGSQSDIPQNTEPTGSYEYRHDASAGGMRTRQTANDVRKDLNEQTEILNWFIKVSMFMCIGVLVLSIMFGHWLIAGFSLLFIFFLFRKE
ncbi:MAG: hypothetical protein J6I35_09020 [Ruminobacter sp.]|uniref:hypothetical protein n=1 Tax=Ruminobacter sp. TaxID=2774296 RepID=UPI001B556037|nr:hypothetical protein [Ruminobacter sp.]MBP3749665.1 hypothetical protein [Ruminobacter sp.]